jgi:tetratricopeptide (TPR) repeat protein
LLFHSNLSRALVILGKTDEALAEADQAVQLSDEENRFHFGLLRAEIFRMSEKFERAEAVCFTLLKEAVKLEDVREIRYALSNIYSAANQVAKAEEQLRLVLQMDPDNATAHNDLGYIMADHNQNLEEAEKLIRRALDLDAEKRPANKIVSADDDQPNAAYIDSLGWVLFRRGRFEEARRELEKAVALPEGEADPVVWDHLGDVCFRLGDTAKTRTVWQKAVKLYEMEKRRKLDKQYKEVKHKLQLLEANLPLR